MKVKRFIAYFMLKVINKVTQTLTNFIEFFIFLFWAQNVLLTIFLIIMLRSMPADCSFSLNKLVGVFMYFVFLMIITNYISKMRNMFSAMINLILFVHTMCSFSDDSNNLTKCICFFWYYNYLTSFFSSQNLVHEQLLNVMFVWLCKSICVLFSDKFVARL